MRDMGGLPEDLLQLLRCPECKTPLQLTPSQDGLLCESCRRVYPIRDGIPILLVDEATRKQTNN